MKHFYVVMVMASSLFFAACGDDVAKKSVEMTTEATQVAKNTVVKTATFAENKAKELAENAKTAAAKVTKKAVKIAQETEEKAAETAKKVKETVVQAGSTIKEKAVQTTEAAKNKIAALVEQVSSPSNAEAGAALYAKCAGCHGKNGKTKALGKSAVIAGQPKASLVESIKGYKAGTRNANGMGTVMKGQVAGMSDDDIAAVSAYITTLK